MEAHYVIEDGLNNAVITETATVVINILSECIEEALAISYGDPGGEVPATTDIKVLYGIGLKEVEYVCGAIPNTLCEPWAQITFENRKESSPSEFCELNCNIVGAPTPQVLEDIDYGTPDYEYLLFEQIILSETTG